MLIVKYQDFDIKMTGLPWIVLFCMEVNICFSHGLVKIHILTYGYHVPLCELYVVNIIEYTDHVAQL